MAGRPKGVPNKAPTEAREAIARLVDGNAHRLSIWLEEVYQTKGAEAAWKCMMDVIEYHIPKLARTELTGQDNGPIKLEVGWRTPE
jgi:hypothetical protein